MDAACVIIEFYKMILTGERKKVNNDFARQELFLIPETNQPAEAGFFLLRVATHDDSVQTQLIDDVDFTRIRPYVEMRVDHYATFRDFSFLVIVETADGF